MTKHPLDGTPKSFDPVDWDQALRNGGYWYQNYRTGVWWWCPVRRISMKEFLELEEDRRG